MNREEGATEEDSGGIGTAVAGRIAKGGITGAVGRLGSKALSLLLQIVLTRVLGPSDYGRYVLGYSVASVGQQVGVLGLNEGVIRYGAIHRSERTEDEPGQVVADSFLLGGLGAIFVAGAIFAFAAQLARVGFGDPAMAPVLRVFALAVPTFIIVELTAAHFQAFERIDLQQSLKSVLRPVLNFVLVVLIFAAGYRLLGSIVAYLLTGTITALVGIGYLVTRMDLHPPRLNRGIRLRAQKLLAFSLPMMLITISFTLAMRTDRFMLGFFRDPEVVGIYNVGAMIAQQFSIVTASLISIFKPIIASTEHAGDDGVQSLYRIVTRWASFGTLGLFVALGIVGEPLLRVFGPSFDAALPVLLVLPLVYVSGALFGPCAALLRMTGRVKIELLNSAVLLILNVLFNLALIPRYGAIGAAIGVLAAGFLTNVIQVIAVRVIYGFHPFQDDHVLAVGYAASAVIATVLSMLYLPILWRVVVGLVVGLTGLSLFYWGLDPVEQDIAIRALGRD